MTADSSPASGNRSYAQFYYGYTACLPVRGLLALCGARLPHPDQFSDTDPSDVCTAAFHGVPIFAPDPQAVKDSVKDGGPYAQTIQARLSDFRDKIVPAANDALREWARMNPFIVPSDDPETAPSIKVLLFTIEIEDDKPFTREDFMEFPVMSEGFIKTALQYEQDRLFEHKTHRERMDHFAADYGFPHFKRFREFMDQLNAHAREADHASYDHLAIPTRYLNLMVARYQESKLLAEVEEKRELLIQQSPFFIRCFFDCRVSSRPFHIDVQPDGVLIRLDAGPLCGSTFVHNSVHVSDRHRVIDPGVFP